MVVEPAFRSPRSPGAIAQYQAKTGGEEISLLLRQE
jgi:hypothetical protein